VIAASLGHHARHVSTHSNVFLVDYLDAVDSMIILSFLIHGAALAMVLLGLDDMSSKHLGIFNFYLWIVENVVVIVDIFNDFNWLVLILFLWLRRTTAPRVRSVVNALGSRAWFFSYSLFLCCKVICVGSSIV
jgi:hypothetical protein